MGLAELDHVRHAQVGEELFRRRKKEVIDACEKCGGAGKISSEVWDDDDIPTTTSVMCSCKVQVLHELSLQEAGLPREFWNAEDIEPEFNQHAFKVLRRYSQNLDAALEHGLGLVLTGKNGSGKSSSACLPLIAAVRQGRSSAFINFPDLVQGWRRAWKDNALGHHLDERVHRDFVVLDELGKEHVGSDEGFVASKFDSLLRLRRGEMLPTVITTNLTVPELVKRYGDSIASLLSDRYKVLKYRPGDFRVRMANTWDDLLGGDE